MAYREPVYNLDVNIWHSGTTPPVGAPDVQTVGNLAWGKRVNVPTAGVTGFLLPVLMMTMQLLLPAHTNIWGDPLLVSGCVVEVPAGTGRYYNVVFVDDLGKGFANEHRGAIISQALPWPHPIP